MATDGKLLHESQTPTALLNTDLNKIKMSKSLSELPDVRRSNLGKSVANSADTANLADRKLQAD